MAFLSIPSVPSSPIPASNASQTDITNFVSAKLDRTNYEDWQNQMVPFLVSQGLMGYIDGSISAPTLIISTEVRDSIVFSVSELILNPAYTHWRQTDQYALRLLHATLHTSVLSDVVGLNTSKAVWNALAEMFSSDDESKCQPLQLLDHFQNMKKEESLSANPLPKCNQDGVLFALNGLEL